jgi:glycosyltransferase involved in cell wall biosynthesis
MLQTYKMVKPLQYKNLVYYYLTRAMDACALRFARSFRPDVYLGLSGTCLNTLKWCKANGIPTIVECGSTHPDFQKRILDEEYARCGIKNPLFPSGYLNIVRREFKEADFIQLPSRFCAQTFIEAGVDSYKIRIVGRAADPAVFKVKAPPKESGTFRFICPSGVNVRKGCRVLFEAWKRLGWKDTELHWVGDPEQSQGVVKRCTTGIIFHPWMHPSRLAELYRSCDVLVLPSFEEGLARVMLEAGLCGLPLIVTPNTGVEDIFDSEGAEGWLVPAGDVDALCKAMSEAKANRSISLLKGQNLANKIQQCFTWSEYAKRVRGWVETI